MGKSGKCWTVMNTLMNIRIINKLILRRAISFQKCRNPTKTLITERAPLQLRSLLRHRKLRLFFKWPTVPIPYFSTFQVLLFILCSVGGNIRDVTEKLMDG